MNEYREMEKRHQAEFNAFPMEFAFGSQQFEAAMKRLGLEPTDTDKVYSFGDTGGFYRRSDAPALHEMLERQEQERQDAIHNDETGDGYITDMFSCKLGNHEYGYTGDVEDALNALGLTMEEIDNDPRMAKSFRKAKNVTKSCMEVKG